MRRSFLLILIALLALISGQAFAQEMVETEDLEPRRSYQVCDWGLLVIEHPEPVQFVSITSPQNYSGVGTAFTISGEGAGLFEGNVVVEISDDEGNVLLTEPTTLIAEEVGGRGPWSLDVDLGALPEARRITVTAYSTEPAEGEIIAQDVVYLSANSQFGLPYIDITEPVSGDAVSGNSLHVEGTAGAIFENAFLIQALDAGGEVLAQSPVIFASPDIGLSGPWSIDLFIFEAEPGTSVELYAFAESMAGDGTIIASDSHLVTFDPFAAPHTYTLILQAGDPITESDDICASTVQEFGNMSTSPVEVTDVRVEESFSTPPMVTLLVSGRKPSFCDMPFRVWLVREGDIYTGAVYYGLEEGSGRCTRDLAPFTVQIPLGTPTTTAPRGTVNGVPLE